MPLVVCVGVCSLDAIAVVDRFPQPDQRLTAEEVVHAGGGPAATAAVAAGRLGVPTHFVGTVGDDPEGRRLVAELADEGIGTEGVTVAAERATTAAVVISDRSRATRAICVRPLEDLVLNTDAVRLVRAAHWVHVDHLGWPAVRAALADVAPADRPRISVDLGYPVAGCDPRGVDLYAPSDQLLQTQYPDLPVEEALALSGAVRAVATQGADGAIGRDADGSLHRVPGLAVDAVSTLGAGDVFHGALLAATVRGRPLPEAIEEAVTVAALSCRGVDGRSAIPTLGELHTYLKEN